MSTGSKVSKPLSKLRHSGELKQAFSSTLPSSPPEERKTYFKSDSTSGSCGYREGAEYFSEGRRAEEEAAQGMNGV